MIRNLYFILIVFMGCAVNVLVASDSDHTDTVFQRDCLTQYCLKQKHAIEIIAIDQFGSSPESTTEIGKQLISFQKIRINLLDQMVESLKFVDWDHCKKLKKDFNNLDSCVLELEQSLEFFKNLK